MVVSDPILWAVKDWLGKYSPSAASFTGISYL